MKFTSTSITFALALAASVNAAPATYGSTGTEISKRDTTSLQNAIALLNEHKAKRDSIPITDLAARENQIVTKVLEYIKDTDLSGKILLYFTTNDFFAPIVKKTIVSLVKNGTINVATLFKSLNDSGLAASVIEDLINDCEFYQEIYKLALNYIGGLVDKIKNKITGGGSSSKRELVAQPELVTRADNESEILTSLMESLKSSGLANQVVEELVVNEDFLKFGADLIKDMIDQKVMTLGELVDAIKDSGLVPSLFKQFFTLDTLKDVTVTALAAARGCQDGSSSSGSSTATTTGGSTPTTTGGSDPSTNPSCKKRKRSYY